MAKKDEENVQGKKDIIKLAVTTLGTLIGSAYGSAKFGPKVHDKYGGAIVGTGIFGGSIAASPKIAEIDPFVALGVMAGSGANLGYQILKTDVVKSKLPDGMQAMLSGFGDNQYLPIANLNGVSDETLYGDPRVREIARNMAEQEIMEYQAAMHGAATALAGNRQLSLPSPEIAANQEQLYGQHFPTAVDW